MVPSAPITTGYPGNKERNMKRDLVKDLTISMLLDVIARLVFEFRGKANDAGEHEAVNNAIKAFKELTGCEP